MTFAVLTEYADYRKYCTIFEPQIHVFRVRLYMIGTTD